MMKKFRLSYEIARGAIFGIAMLFSVSCGTLDEFEEPPPEYENVKKIDRRTPTVNEIREQLSQMDFVPNGGDGYSVMQVDPGPDGILWLKNNAAHLSELSGYLPDGFVIELVGHTDSTGPRLAGFGSPGNLWISRERARRLYEALIAGGFERQALRFSGVADDELISDLPADSPKQRRVTLTVRLAQ
ncbi:MAG: hypothetical protein KDK33_03715 [Leptospiraceae bacterium]|nr:hypothetical protein [Leptospiraceae bacterium]